jgi:hypothetical protein
VAASKTSATVSAAATTAAAAGQGDIRRKQADRGNCE